MSGGAVVVRTVRRPGARALAAVTSAAAAVGVAGGAAIGWRAGRRAKPATRTPGPADASDVDAPKPATDTRADAIDRRRANLVLRRLDRFQQRRPAAGFPIAVAKKFADDEAGSLAALIAYYGFLSMFPLLLALTTILARVLQDNPELQARILDSTLSQFPVIGDQIRQNVHSLRGSGVALAVGVGGALWGGMGVMRTAGDAMDEVWEVPKRDRPRFVRALLRAAGMLVVIGGGIVATTVLSGFGTATATTLPLRLAGVVLAAVVNIAVFLLGFRVLTVRDVGWRQLLPGAVTAGVGWQVLQGLGSYYVTHQLRGASQTYGMFAVVIGLLSWLYLLAQLLLFAAEINVVRATKLWPRSLAGELTDADRRAYAAYAEVEERRHDEDVGVGFTNGHGGSRRVALSEVVSSADVGDGEPHADSATARG